MQDQMTARRLRSIMIREDLIPHYIDPWQIFDRERWTITEFERNVNLQRAITRRVTDHIRALEDVDNANVTIAFPQSRLFSEEDPVTVSLIITPKIDSDIRENRQKIIYIQAYLKMTIEGLRDENITITDNTGRVLNDSVN